MVTLDKIVKNVGQFSDITRGSMDYERAKQGLALIKEAHEEFKEKLKKQSGYGPFNIPEKTEKKEIKKGDIKFTISSNETTKKPKYKDAVNEMQNYVNAVNYMASRGHTISGVAKEEDKWVISMDRLLEEFMIKKQEVMIPGISQRISYKATKDIDTPQEIDLNYIDCKLDENNFKTYIQLDNIKKNLEKYVEDYESALASSGEQTVKVSKRKAYEVQESTKELVSWANIVNTLLSEKEDDEGELVILADESISLAEKKRELPFYDLFMRDVRGEKKLYIGLESVYNRIEDLKIQNTTISESSKIKQTEVV